MEQFAILYGSYKQVRMPDKKYTLDKDSFGYVINQFINSNYADQAYELAGIDLPKLRVVIASKKPSDLKNVIAKKELLPFAKSAYAYYRLQEEGIKLIIPGKQGKTEPFLGSGMGIMANYNGWMLIKKVSSSAEPYEFAGFISSIYEKFMEKYYLFSKGSVPTEKIKIDNLENTVAILKQAAIKGALDFIETALSYKGFRPYPYLDALVAAYPDLKPKKPRGRLPGGK